MSDSEELTKGKRETARAEGLIELGRLEGMILAWCEEGSEWMSRKDSVIKAWETIRDTKLYKLRGMTWTQYCEQQIHRTRRAVNIAIAKMSEPPKRLLEDPETVIENSDSDPESVKNDDDKTDTVDVKHVVQQNESQSDPLPAPQEVKRLDSVGRKIPDAISGYWDRKGEVNVILTGISRLKCMVESAKQGDDPLWRDVTCQDVVNPLVRAYDEVKMALPYAVCPYCQGLVFETCQHCRGKGWMNRFAWNTFAPSELKQLIQSD